MEFKLIVKKLNGTLSEEEKTIFSNWYNESSSHRKYFNSVKNSFNKGTKNIDIEKGWLRMQSNLKVRKQKNNYWKYTAAASVLLLLSLNFIFNTKEANKVEETSVVDVKNSIGVGTDKAILTLGDGSLIALEKGKTYSADNLNSNGKELIYANENNSKSEIVYNYLTIPRGGQFFIKLADGTEVWLNSESKLKYPVEFSDGITREVELIYGEAYFDVSPSSDHKGSKFRVVNQNQEVEVLGTEFNIKAYEEENILTTLVEGKVTVSNSFYKESLVPNQQSKLNLKSGHISINEIDVYGETSWRKGFFSFKSKSLKEIMVVLSRWYDIEVEFANEEVEKVKFNGVLSKRDEIEEILTSIKNTNFITDYEIKDKRITIE